MAGTTAPVTDIAYLVTSDAAGQSQTFDLSIRYDNSAQGWLTIRPDTSTTPAKLRLSADPTNLAVGTYSAQVVASVGPLHSGAWTNVSFTVAPAGSNPGGVGVSPSSLTFFANSISSQSITVQNAPGGTASGGFSVFANPSDWLTVTQSGQMAAGSVTVLPVISGVSAGTYTGSVTITAAGKSTVVPVTLFVPTNTSGSTITLTPAQRSLTYNFQLNSSVNPQQTVYVSTDSTQYTNFTATVSAPWIRVAASSYQTPSASASCFAPGLFYVSVDPTGIGVGTYHGTVTLSASGVSPVDIPLTLTVSSSPVLNAGPSFVWLDADSNILSSNLAVTGSTAFYFSATSSAPWLTVTPASAVASNSPANLTVTANVAGLPSGTFNATITLTGLGGNPIETIPVELHTASTAVNSTFQAKPDSVTFAGIAGTDVFPQFVLASLTGGAHATVTAAAVSDGGWLSVDPMSGAAPLLTKIMPRSGVPAGSYTGSVVYTALETGDQVTVNVTYRVAPRVMVAAPAALTFTQQSVGAPLASQDVQVTANLPSTFTIVSHPSWANITPSTGLTTPAKLTVSVDPTGLAPGSYQDTIVLHGPNDVAISVAVTIAAPLPPSVTPNALSFQYELGSPAPAAQTIQIASPSGPLPYTATASTVSGVNWLTVGPASGSAPATVTVKVNVAQLVPGQHAGTVTVALQNASSNFSVPVTVTVTGSTVQVHDILNGAALTPTSLAPGEIITLTGFGLGPATAVSARPSTAGAYPTVLAGTSVLFDGAAAPLLMVQDEQVNAIVPYALDGRANSKLQVQTGSSFSIPIDVKVTPAAPGIFTAGGSGRGAAAALNGDSTPNSAINPAQRGSVIVLYLTGEGQTDPPGQDGRVIATDVRKPLLPVTALIGGQPAEVLYAGSGPTLVSGLCQVNLRIPDTIAAGTQPVEIQVGGVPSQRGVTVEVR